MSRNLQGYKNDTSTANRIADVIARPLIRRQWAIIVGIDIYQSSFRTLRNAANDARDVAELLAREYKFTLFPEGHVLLNESATLSAIQRSIDTSLAQATDDTRWLLYFAGHGVVQGEHGYLIPTDALNTDAETYLSLDWLIKRCLTRTNKAAEILIILDACQSGQALVHTNQLTDTFPSDWPGGQVRQIITSGNPQQHVLDTDGLNTGRSHSVFTQSLLDALSGRTGIHERDGSIRFAPLLSYLASEIPRRLQIIGQSNDQQPIGGYLIGNPMHRQFVFETSAPRLDPAILRGLHSEEPSRRKAELEHILVEVQAKPELRSLAVQLTSEHLSRSFQAGQVIMKDAAVEVRQQAAATLASFKDPGSLGVLIDALDDVPEVSRAAIVTLGSLGDKKAIPKLLDQLITAEPGKLLDIVGALGELGDNTAMTYGLRECLQRNMLVPFVGPDFPQNLTGLPDRATLARNLAQYLRLPETNSLATVAAASMIGNNPRLFRDILTESLHNRALVPRSIYQELARLPAPFWISGAYDSFLPRALQAGEIFTGAQTRFIQAQPKTVVRLVGDIGRPNTLCVLEAEYMLLRGSEDDRSLLVNYLRHELQGKVLLFLGYDPDNPDTEFLIRHVLNGHLAGIHARAFIVWSTANSSLQWNRNTIWPICESPEVLINLLARG